MEHPTERTRWLIIDAAEAILSHAYAIHQGARPGDQATAEALEAEAAVLLIEADDLWASHPTPRRHTS